MLLIKTQLEDKMRITTCYVLIAVCCLLMMGCSEGDNETLASSEPERLPGITIINAALDYVRSDMTEFHKNLVKEQDPDSECEWSIGNITHKEFTETDILITVTAEHKLDCPDVVFLGVRHTFESISLYTYQFNVNWTAATGKDAISLFSRDFEKITP